MAAISFERHRVRKRVAAGIAQPCSGLRFCVPARDPGLPVSAARTRHWTNLPFSAESPSPGECQRAHSEAARRCDRSRQGPALLRSRPSRAGPDRFAECCVWGAGDFALPCCQHLPNGLGLKMCQLHGTTNFKSTTINPISCEFQMQRLENVLQKRAAQR